MSYESFAYAMNFILECYDLMIYIHLRNQVNCFENLIILVVTT